MFLYLITNSINAKVYVGKTIRKNLESYFHLNLKRAEQGRKDKNYLYSAIRKYGRDAFKIEIICRPCSESFMSALECWYIGFYDSNNSQKGYNLTKGGDGVSGMKQSELSKQKVRERSIGNTWTLGRKHSDETRRLISESCRRAIQNGHTTWNLKKPWSEEARKKMSDSAKKRWENISNEERNNYKEKGLLNANKRWNPRGQ